MQELISDSIHPQGLSSKEAELLKDGSNGDKMSTLAKPSPVPTDLAKSIDPSASELEAPKLAPSSSTGPSYGLESQPKKETDGIATSSGTSKNYVFKIGLPFWESFSAALCPL